MGLEGVSLYQGAPCLLPLYCVVPGVWRNVTLVFGNGWRVPSFGVEAFLRGLLDPLHGRLALLSDLDYDFLLGPRAPRLRRSCSLPARATE